MPGPDMQELLQQGAWLHRLAARLLRDADDASDTVQDTWMAALRARVGPRQSPRAWLRELLRGQVLHRARGQARRQRREQVAATLVEERAECAASSLERLAQQRRLTELVAALPEPFRTTIVLRYFEDRPAAQIARQLGVPAGTVRWRTREALQRLRAALDGQDATSGGSRWRLALAPLARAAPPLPPAFGPLLWPGATVALLAAAAILLVTGQSARDRHQPVAAAAAPSPGDDGRVPPPSRARSAPRPPGAGAQALLAWAAAGRTDRDVPPAVRLARAEEHWRAGCSSPQGLADHHGLCAAVVEPAGDLCPGARAAGRRLVSLGRSSSPEGALAVAGFRAVQADARATAGQRGAARLRLAEVRFEELLAIAPLMDLTMDRTDTAGYTEDQRRFSEWLRQFGTTTGGAARELEQLAEGGAGPPAETAALARAHLAELWLAAGRLLLATEIPSALVSRNRWGADERALFCQDITERAEALFQKASARAAVPPHPDRRREGGQGGRQGRQETDPADTAR